MKYFCFLITFLHIPLLTHLSKGIEFNFQDEPIDVVIPCTEKDLPILEMCIQGIKENGINIRRVIVVSKKILSDSAEWFDENRFPFSFNDVKEALCFGDPKRKEILDSTNRTGWYYQQLLKLYSYCTIPNISSNILVLDSDTIFLKSVSFTNKNNASIFSLTKEYHIPYFKHAPKLIPNFKKLHESSGIANYMLFQKPVLNMLFEEIESEHKVPLWISFCNLVDVNDLGYSGASEFEIYFNYAISKSNQFSTRELVCANLSRIKSYDVLKKLDLTVVSIHAYSRK